MSDKYNVVCPHCMWHIAREFKSFLGHQCKIEWFCEACGWNFGVIT